MSDRDRRKSLSRRPTLLSVDSLEPRQLLSASPLSRQALETLHAEKVAHIAEFHAEKAAYLAEVHAYRVELAEARKSETIVKATKNPFLDLYKITPKKAAHAHKISKFAADDQGSDDGSGDDGSGDPGTSPVSVGAQNTTPIAGTYTPIQLETAYGTSLLGAANQGQGVTIGIIDEGTDPNIVADTNAYSAQYGLPLMDGANGDPTLSVVNDTAIAPVGTAVAYGTGGETSLDVEIAHAMAPKANILLVQVPATGSNANAFNELLHGAQVAAQSTVNGTPVVVISTSYGLSEASIGNTNVVSLNSTYLTNGAPLTTVATTFSTGDGSTPLFPATSPNVIGVGGTSLYLASAKGKYSFETAWGGLAGAGAGGGGASTNFAAPTFQSSNGVALSAKRTIPDISMDADVVTAVSVYDSLDGGSSPWTAFGGTSVASPMFAGVLALAQQTRIGLGKSALTSLQINSAMYAAYNSANYSTYFHDVTLGKNANVNNGGRTTVAGFSATTGYDEATGIGSPKANTLDAYLAGL